MCRDVNMYVYLDVYYDICVYTRRDVMHASRRDYV